MPSVLTLDCALIVAVSLLGGMLPLATVLNHTRLQVYLSFSAGSMLGAAFFHMLPEAVRMGSPGTFRWSALGLLALFFLERFFAFHHHESRDRGGGPWPLSKSDGQPEAHPDDLGGLAHPRGTRRHGEPPLEALSWGRPRSGWPCIPWSAGWRWPAPSRPTSPSGEAVGATGWGVFLATVVHKPADALTIVSLMLRSGVPRWLAHLVNFGSP